MSRGTRQSNSGYEYACVAKDRAMIVELRKQVKKLEADRSRITTEFDDFQCSIASALGWDCQGKPFDQCIRELRSAAEAASKQMKRVDRWECEDGSVWGSPEAASKRDELLAECQAAVAELRLRDTPVDDHCKFSNGNGCVQQPRGSRVDLWSFLRSKGVNRDSTGPIGKLAYRHRCMDEQDREWGQPYFANNPDKAESQLDVGATSK